MKLRGYPVNFWLICLALLFFMISFNIILPEMNDIITRHGGEKFKGLIIAFFGVSAALSRPFSGKLSDTIGRKKVMMIGLMVAFVITITYPLTGLVFFLTLRFLHGFSAGFLPTGATALVTDILPEDRRGIGMGIWGTFVALGIGGAQFLSGDIVRLWGLNGLFMVSAICILFATIIIVYTSETLEKTTPFRWQLLKIRFEDIIEPTVVGPSIVMACSAVSTGIVFVVTPDMSEPLGLTNKGWFFVFYMIATIAVRLFAGQLSDRIGRRKTLLIGMSLMAVGMGILAFSTNWIISVIGSGFFGLATGISSPSLMAWTADLAPAARRGVAAGTLFIALEIGVIFGSLSTLITYNNTFASIPVVFLVGTLAAIYSVGYLIWHLYRRESKT